MMISQENFVSKKNKKIEKINQLIFHLMTLDF